MFARYKCELTERQPSQNLVTWEQQMPRFTGGKVKSQRLTHLPKVLQSQDFKSSSPSHLPACRSCIPAFLQKMVQWVLSDLNLQPSNPSGTQMDPEEEGRSHVAP